MFRVKILSWHFAAIAVSFSIASSIPLLIILPVARITSYNVCYTKLLRPLVVALYFIINPKYRWILLLVASYYFYMCWSYKYIILIAFSTVIDYLAAIMISRAKKKSSRISFLMFSLTTNLGLLFFFKYCRITSYNVCYTKLLRN